MPGKATDNDLVITDLKTADAVLKEIGELERRISTRENAMNDDMARIRAEADAALESLRERLKTLDAVILDYAGRYDDYDGRQFVSLTFGSFGFRRTSEVKPAPRSKWEKVIEHLKRLGWTDGIRVKESINKEYLHSLTDAELAEAGARRVPYIRCWREIRHDQLGNAA